MILAFSCWQKLTYLISPLHLSRLMCKSKSEHPEKHMFLKGVVVIKTIKRKQPDQLILFFSLFFSDDLSINKP